MMTPPGRGRQQSADPRPDVELRRARAVRDAGLQRISRLTGWVIAGAVALTVGLSEVAAHSWPGRSSQQAAAQPSAPHTSGVPAPSGGGDQSAPGLQPPEQVPQPSDAGSGAVSGGS